MKRRLVRVAIKTAGLSVALLLATLTIALVYCTAMPGTSFVGAAAPLDGDGQHVSDELRRHVRGLAYDIGVRNGSNWDSLHRAEKHLNDELAPLTARLGVSLRREVIDSAVNDTANLVLEAKGQNTGPLLLIGAHYDTALGGTPGANDNGSGVASALVLAERLTRQRHALPIRIVLFANEEMPHFMNDSMGSLWHARGCKRRGESLRAMFSLETMGYYSNEPHSQRYPPPLSSLYPDRGNFIGFVGNLSSRALLRESIAAFRQHASIPAEGAALPENLPGVAWSDHWSFWQQGYPAVMVTDTALFRDPNYHEPSDTIDKLDFERLSRVVLGLETMVLELAQR